MNVKITHSSMSLPETLLFKFYKFLRTSKVIELLPHRVTMNAVSLKVFKTAMMNKNLHLIWDAFWVVHSTKMSSQKLASETKLLIHWLYNLKSVRIGFKKLAHLSWYLCQDYQGIIETDFKCLNDIFSRCLGYSSFNSVHSGKLIAIMLV